MFNVNEFKEDCIRDLERIGIVAEVDLKKVPKTKLYRMIVISEQFSRIGYQEEQKICWRVVDKNLSSADQLHILSIDSRISNDA